MYPSQFVEAYRPEPNSKCKIHDENGISTWGVCVEILFPVPVLRRTECHKHGGYYKYRRDWQPAILGYTCRGATQAPVATSHR